MKKKEITVIRSKRITNKVEYVLGIDEDGLEAIIKEHVMEVLRDKAMLIEEATRVDRKVEVSYRISQDYLHDVQVRVTMTQEEDFLETGEL